MNIYKKISIRIALENEEILSTKYSGVVVLHINGKLSQAGKIIKDKLTDKELQALYNEHLYNEGITDINGNIII